MNEETRNEAQQTDAESKSWRSRIKRYRIHLSVGMAVLVVGVSALIHYKNGRIEEELIKAVSEYQKGLLAVGGELSYDSLTCSGFLSTDCTARGIRLSLLGEEQLSIASLRVGKVEEIAALKGFVEGGNARISIDVEIEEARLPRPLIEKFVAQNVSDAFQQSTLEKLGALNLELKATIEGSPGLIKNLDIDCLKLDNAIMPIRFSMKASDIASGMPDSLVLQTFTLEAENRAISEVTYESVRRFAESLGSEEKVLLLKEFGLSHDEMKEKEKASLAINETIAKRFEADLSGTTGIVEQELIRAMISMLRGEAEEIVLRGSNQKRYTLLQIQNFLIQSSAMSQEESKRFMSDKFVIEVETD